MRLVVCNVICLAFAALAAPLQAAPLLYYNAFSGSLFIVNDIPGSILDIKSPSGKLNVPTGSSIPSPGVINTSGLPTLLSVLNTPEGYHGIGGVVDIGTPKAELSFDWYASAGQPANPGSIFETPEPATASIAVVAAIGFAAASRRRSRGRD